MFILIAVLISLQCIQKANSLNYEAIVDADVRMRRNSMKGYLISGLDKLGEVALGQPFFKVSTDSWREIEQKIVLVGAPLYKDIVPKFDLLIEAGYMPMGIMSYRSYPLAPAHEVEVDNRMETLTTPDGRDQVRTYAGWLHCVREPEKYLGEDYTGILLSDSDVQWVHLGPLDKEEVARTGKYYDVIYHAGSDGEWHDLIKNFTLAVKCFERLVDELGLKILIVSRDAPENLVGKVDSLAFLPQKEFLNLVAKAKVLFVSSVSDASPRVISQALVLNTAIVVNRNIVGGWKYANEGTGALFTDENDVVEVVRDVLAKIARNEINPRDSHIKF